MTSAVGARAACALAGLLAALPAAALAQDKVAEFYRDRTLTVIIGSTPGGGIDTYGRLVARHIGKHIPGSPRVVPQNMPGAGSIVAANHTFNAAPRDGSQITTVVAGAIIDPLLTGKKPFDPTRLTYVGNINFETQVCVLRADAPIKTFADAFSTEIIVGGSGPGSTIYDYPLFLKNFIGAKVRMVAGYPGSREIMLAAEKGEVHGTCGINWSSAKLQFPDALKPGGRYRVVLQEAVKGLPELDAAGVPLVSQFAKSPDDRPVLEVMYGLGMINRVFMAPPEIPADRADALRRAFMGAAADPELLAEARKLNIDIVANDGADVTALVDRLYRTPPAIVERMKKATETK